MLFHPFKIDFYKKRKDNILEVCKSADDILKDDTQPIFYIEEQDKKYLFGDVIEYNDKLYILLFYKGYKNNYFHHFKLSEIIPSYSYKISYNYKDDFSFNDMKLIYNEGNYLGNIYLYKYIDRFISKKLVETILKNNEKSTDMDDLLKLKDNESDIYLKQFDFDLLFNDANLNLIKKDDWLSIYERKNNEFMIQLDYTFKRNYYQKSDDKFLINQLSLFSPDFINQEKIPQINIYSGTLLKGQYDSLDVIKKITKMLKTNILLDFKAKKIKVDLELIKNQLIYYETIFFKIDLNGNIILDFANKFNLTEEDLTPLISLDEKMYKYIANEDMEIYQESLLKIL